MTTLMVNGERREVAVPADMPLFWVMRDVLGLAGAKFGPTPNDGPRSQDMTPISRGRRIAFVSLAVLTLVALGGLWVMLPPHAVAFAGGHPHAAPSMEKRNAAPTG